MKLYLVLLPALYLSISDRAQALDSRPKNALIQDNSVSMDIDITTAELHALQNQAHSVELMKEESSTVAGVREEIASPESLERLYRGNQADKDLDMRPLGHEPEVSAEEAELRFDTYRSEPYFRVPKVLVEHITDDRTKLTPGYYFYGPYQAGEAGPLIFDQDGASLFSERHCCIVR